MGVRLEPLHDSLASKPRAALLMLSGAVGLLFLIVCANIANLQLEPGASRARELTIRHALGPDAERILRQLLTESHRALAAGGALGAWPRGDRADRADALRRVGDCRSSRSCRSIATVTFFAVVALAGGALIFGIVPALTASRGRLVTERGESASRDARGTAHLLVAAKVALSVVLVVGAVLLVRSLTRLQDVDPGFIQEQASRSRCRCHPHATPTTRSAIARSTKSSAGCASSRVCRRSAPSSTLALRGFTWTGDTTIEGRHRRDYERERATSRSTPGYFGAMGTRLLAGRLFDAHDTRDAAGHDRERLAARRYFPARRSRRREAHHVRPAAGRPRVGHDRRRRGRQKQDGLDSR